MQQVGTRRPILPRADVTARKPSYTVPYLDLFLLFLNRNRYKSAKKKQQKKMSIRNKCQPQTNVNQKQMSTKNKYQQKKCKKKQMLTKNKSQPKANVNQKHSI